MSASERRGAIGEDVELFVDANGAYHRKQALGFAESFASLGVTWFEEPVSSDDLDGLRLLRDRAPAGLEIAAGEYGYDTFYFRQMLEAGAVDVLRRTRRVARESVASCAPRRCARRVRCRFPRIAVPRCTSICAVRRGRRFTSNIFMTTTAFLATAAVALLIILNKRPRIF